MRKRLLTGFVCGVGLVLLTQNGIAEVMKQDNEHIRTWNNFAKDILALHERRIADLEYTKKTGKGGYAQQADFYIEEKFYVDDRLLSIVQWEKENPELMHSIEVFIHDDKGRVVRDYTAAYLPTYHNAPTQTLVSFHRYNGELHAFRSFDASGFRIIERCTGKWRSKDVNLLLDEDEIAENIGDPQGSMATAEYNACFTDLAEEAGKYLNPQ